MITRSPNATSSSRTRMTASRWVSTTWRRRVSSIARGLVPDRREKHREHAVDDDYHEDRLHDRGGDVPAERLGRALDGEPFHRGDEADDEGHERGLDDPGEEGVERDRRPQARQVDVRADVAV